MASTLQARLDRMSEGFRSQAPPEVLDTMHRATQELVDRGAAAEALGNGDEMPHFTLPNQNGDQVSSRDLLARGPLVLTFFRGHW